MRVLRSTAAVLVAAAALAGCSDGPPPPTATPSGPSAGPVATPQETPGAAAGGSDGFYVRSDYRPVRIRTEMVRVERYADHAVLRIGFLSLEPEPVTTVFLFGSGLLDAGMGGFRLVDPVGRKYYPPLQEHGDTFGSRQNGEFRPGVRYLGAVYYPPIPPEVSVVTVVSSGNSPGLYAGVPVVDGTEPAAAVPRPTGMPAPGDTVELEADTPPPGFPGSAVDLFGIAESPERETSSSSTEERIGLRTDVLFAFDKATLTAKAAAILDQVAQETRAKADPAKPPIRIVGHTDSHGADAYNLALSRRRAATIHRELARRLGTGYRYAPSGVGEAHPIAKEGGAGDAQARARNRRVEISYRLKQTTTTTSATAAPGTARPVAGPDGPAATPHPDPEFVAERTATVEGVGYRLRVAAPFRDGAFLVLPLEFTRDKKLSASALAFSRFSTTRWSCLGNYNDFTLHDPATATTYLTARIAPTSPATGSTPRCLDGTTGGSQPNLPVLTYLYLTAPPRTTTTATLSAGPFGPLPNLPLPP
ncbi:hypothetical protein GCM10027589_03950 [Actinocorallia lasiicapitis]